MGQETGACRNYVAVYQGLLTFRNEMLAFAIERLQASLGPDWWEVGVCGPLRSYLEQLDALKGRHAARALRSVSRDAADLYDWLDVQHIGPLIQHNWKTCFKDSFDGARDKLMVYLGELGEVRNLVAHPESKDLSREDAVRALDNMVRILRTVRPQAADDVKKIYDEIGRADRPAWLNLRDGSVDYEPGLRQIEQLLHESGGAGSKRDERAFQRGLRRLMEALWLPAASGAHRDEAREQALADLNRLARDLLKKDFLKACTVVDMPADPKEARRRIVALQELIDRLSGDLKMLSQKRQNLAGQGSGTSYFDRKIRSAQSKLEAANAELTHLLDTSAPPAFFLLQRQVRPPNRSEFHEEELLEVQVSLTNLGRRCVEISYTEGLSEGLALVDGKTSLVSLVAPRACATLAYRCYGSRAGEERLFCHDLTFEGRSPDWDTTPDASLVVKPGNPPSLEGKRYYAIQPEGIKLVTRLSNVGQKRACSVRFDETVAVRLRPERRIPHSCRTEVWGGYGHSAELVLPTTDPEKVDLPNHTRVEYQDSEGRNFRQLLPGGWKRMEYNFPTTPGDIPITGREGELQRLAYMLDAVAGHGPGREGPQKRVALVEADEGLGKTRLVWELQRLASEQGVQCFSEDARNGSPLKRLLRVAIGQPADLVDDAGLEEALALHLPRAACRPGSPLLRYLSVAASRFERDEVASLCAQVFVLIRIIAQKAPLLVVLENLQAVPDDLEHQLLRRLLEGARSSGDPLLICATARPLEDPVRRRLGLTQEHCEVLRLPGLGREDTRQLVDSLVPFPRLSGDLHEFVYERSHGNPLYVIEILRRLLDATADLLTIVNDEWRAAPGTDLSTLIPQRVEELILARLDEMPGDSAELARILSVVNVELPVSLIERLSALELPHMSRRDLHQAIDTLVRAGLLVEHRVGGGARGDYAFEHQLKQEVLYASLPKARRTALHGQLVDLLTGQPHDPDRSTQVRHLARHILAARSEYHVAHYRILAEAAELERNQRHFRRSVQLLDATLAALPDPHPDRVDLLLGRSAVFIALGRWPAALKDLQLAEQIVSALVASSATGTRAARRLRTRVLKELGTAMLHQPGPSLTDAERKLKTALASMEGGLLGRWLRRPPVEEECELAELHLALAEVHFRSGNLRGFDSDSRWAEKHARRVERLSRESSKRWWVYFTLGRMYLDRALRSKADAAEPLYEDASQAFHLALEHAPNDPYEQGRTRCALADTFRHLKEHAAAQGHYLAAIDLQKSIDDLSGMATSYEGLGESYLGMDSLGQAKHCCEIACQLWRDIGDIDGLWESCFTLARVHLDSGDVARGIGCWEEARTVLFRQGRYDHQTRAKREEIAAFILRLCDECLMDKRYEAHRLTCLEDRDLVVTPAEVERSEIVRHKIELAREHLEKGKLDETVSILDDVVEIADSPETRAAAHELLADAYMEGESSNLRLPPPAETAMEAAHPHFLEAARQRLQNSQVHQALKIWDKHMRLLLPRENGLFLIDSAYHELARAIAPKRSHYRRLRDTTVNFLLENHEVRNAGDIAVQTLHAIHCAREAGEDISLGLKDIRSAEELYRKGDAEVCVWGLNMVIPLYFLRGAWKEVVRCIEDLFEATLKAHDVEEFLEAFSLLNIIEQYLTEDELRRGIELALGGPEAVEFDDEQRARLYLNTAKYYSHLADRADDPEERRGIEDKALDVYDRALEMDLPHLRKVVLNDTAIILEHRGDLEGALAMFTESIALEDVLVLQGRSPVGRCNRASLYLRLERVDEARADLERAIEYARDSVESWRARRDEAAEIPLTPLEIGQLHYCLRSAGHAYEIYSVLLLRDGDLERAAEYVQEAEKTLRECGVQDSSVSSLARLLYSVGW